MGLNWELRMGLCIHYTRAHTQHRPTHGNQSFRPVSSPAPMSIRPYSSCSCLSWSGPIDIVTSTIEHARIRIHTRTPVPVFLACPTYLDLKLNMCIHTTVIGLILINVPVICFRGIYVFVVIWKSCIFT
jgi:hypothetical protein